MSITFYRYNEFLNRVIEWNRVAKNGFQNDSDSIKLQKSITKEELDETSAAIEMNDKKETLDGIADVFVTAGFLNYMKTQNTDIPVQIFSQPEAIDVHKVLQNIDVERQSSVGGPSHYDIQKLYAWASHKWSQEEVDDYFERVLSSNESKFTPASQWDDSELELATEKYAKRGFHNIVAVDATFNGVPVKVLRADYGKGKILKPSTFIEP